MIGYGFLPDLIPKKVRYLMELESKIIEMSNMLASKHVNAFVSGNVIDIPLELEDVEELKEKVEEMMKILNKLEKAIREEVGVEP